MSDELLRDDRAKADAELANHAAILLGLVHAADMICNPLNDEDESALDAVLIVARERAKALAEALEARQPLRMS